jgi:hypothetical protein
MGSLFLVAVRGVAGGRQPVARTTLSKGVWFRLPGNFLHGSKMAIRGRAVHHLVN